MDYGLENFLEGEGLGYIRENPEEVYSGLLEEAQKYDKLQHVAVSCAISTGTIEGVKFLYDDPSYRMKAGVAIINTNLGMGTWEGIQLIRGAADPRDIVANNIGIGMSLAMEAYRDDISSEDKVSSEEGFEKVAKALESDD